MSAPARNRPLKVLINLCWLVPGVVGGSEESTTDSIRALLEGDHRDLDIELAVLRPFLEVHGDLADRLICHVAPDWSTRGKWARIAVEQTWLARTARRSGAAVVHHAGGVLPLVHPAKTVLTVHDLQPLDHPENFVPMKRLYLRAMIGRSARAADVVCVPSRFTAERLQRRVPIDPSRLIEVPWPVPQRKPSALSDEPGGVLYPGWSRERRFVLYPAITYPHKRHSLLVAAFDELAARYPELDLVMTGGAAQCEEPLMDDVATRGLAHRVKRLGRVPEAELERLYAHAEVVAIPSNYEGFGLPAIEALTHGVPVIASRSGSLPEILPDDWMVEGNDPEPWAEAMEQVLQLGAIERARRVDRGAMIASRFTPERTATALRQAYRRAGGW